MKFQRRSYQKQITAHIAAHPRCNIFATMGSGKTGSVLWAINKMFQSGELQDWDAESGTGDRVLVLAPLRVASGTWPAEQAKWQFPALRVADGTGSRAYREDVMTNDNANVICCNYDVLDWLVEFWGDRWPFTVIVADESTKLKSFRGKMTKAGTGGGAGGSKRAKALSRVAHKKVKRFINLTGTPAPNGLKDLWGQCWFLDGGQRLGLSYTAFTDRWFINISSGEHKAARMYAPRPGADAEIHAKIADVSLTVDAAEFFGCDAPIVVPVVVPLPAKARKIYTQMENELFAQLDAGQVEAANAAARTAKCLQIAGGAVYVTDDEGEPSRDWDIVHNAKLDALESIYDELNGAPLLVAYQYKHDLTRILAKFPEAVALENGERGNKQIEAWNRGELPMLCVHPASAGHGLNLQDGGHHLAFFNLTWNFEHYAQIIERIGPVRQHQAGHPRPVFVYQIQAEGTLDQVVNQRLEGKGDVQKILMDYCKQKRG
jgi:SNF2 family DNA or RNA helicase